MDENSKKLLLKKIRDYKFDKRHTCTLEEHFEMQKKDKFRKMSKLAEMSEEEKARKRRDDVIRQTELHNYKISVSDESTSRSRARSDKIAYKVRQDSIEARRVIRDDNYSDEQYVNNRFVVAQKYHIIPQYSGNS